MPASSPLALDDARLFGNKLMPIARQSDTGEQVMVCVSHEILSQKSTISSCGDIRMADMDPWSVMSVAADTKARPIRRLSSLDVTSCSSAQHDLFPDVLMQA